MKNILLVLLTFCVPFIGLSQIGVGRIDNFQDYTTRNWARGTSDINNVNIADGGPDGAGDNFLRITSRNVGLEAYKLYSYNLTQWRGNYTAAGVTHISMDVRNSGDEIIFLRVAFQGDFSRYKWASKFPIAVVPGQGWKRIVFPLRFSAMENVGTTGYDYTYTMSHVSIFKILHNDVPAWLADNVRATLDIDNIRANDNTVLSVEDYSSSKDKILITPNPSSDYIRVVNITEDTAFKIYDLNGRLIIKGETADNKEIDIQNLSPALYIISLESGKNYKFVKSN